MAWKKMKTPIKMGDARFTLYAEGCIRLEFSRGGQFTDDPSILVGRGERARPKSAEVQKSSKRLQIRTPQFELTYTPNGDEFSPENLTIAHKDYRGDKKVWAPGKEDRGNLGTVPRSLDFWKWCGGPERHPNQGILSTEGGHYLEDRPRVYWNREYDWPEHHGQRIQSDGYFFAYGRDYKQALKDFVSVFGPIPMVPRYAFGFWYSKWHDFKQHEFVQLAKRYHREGIPLDVMIIDTDWRDHWGGYDWSKKTFPDPKKLMKDLHDLGLYTSLNDHPGYDDYDSLPDTDSHIPAIRKKLGPLPYDGRWACDWSNARALRAWKDVLLGPQFDLGMDFWWIDGWIKSPFPDVDSQFWANEQYYELAEEKTGKRGLVLSRWGGIGSHRYPVQFSGDTHSEWETLKHQVEMTARSGNLGAVYWSHDIGGFMGREISDELFLRWSQFGAMSPIFRTHSDHGIREPWRFGRETKKRFKKQTRIRAALAPYWYHLSREAHDTGLPLCRPLYLEYNDDDGGALYRKHQYTIGRDILVIPADGPADERTGLYRKRAFFPDGVWIALEAEDVHHGLDDRPIDIPLERIPTYIRRGAILPCQPVGNTIGVKAPGEIHFEYYPDSLEASSIELYEDDGESKEYEAGAYTRLPVSASRTPDGLEWTVKPAEGRYKGMPKNRTVVLRALLDEAERPVAAKTKTGKGRWTEVSFSTTQKALAGTAPTPRRYVEVRVTLARSAVQVRVELDAVT